MAPLVRSPIFLFGMLAAAIAPREAVDEFWIVRWRLPKKSPVCGRRKTGD